MSHIDVVPIEKNARHEENWLDYLSCVVAACASDGFSDTERTAIASWMSHHKIPVALLDKAFIKANSIDLASLASNPAARHFAPYILRDAIRLSSIDGQSDVEKKKIESIGKIFGFSTADVDVIRKAVQTHDESLSLWQSIISR